MESPVLFLFLFFSFLLCGAPPASLPSISSRSPAAIREDERGLPLQRGTAGADEADDVGEHRRRVGVADLLAQAAARLHLRAVGLGGDPRERLERLLELPVVVGLLFSFCFVFEAVGRREGGRVTKSRGARAAQLASAYMLYLPLGYGRNSGRSSWFRLALLAEGSASARRRAAT